MVKSQSSSGADAATWYSQAYSSNLLRKSTADAFAFQQERHRYLLSCFSTEY